MARKPTITLVGAGNLAQALGRALQRAGYAIAAVVSRDLPDSRRRARALARTLKCRALTRGAPLVSDVLWLCVTDDGISATARALAPTWRGRVALHSSGARSSGELRPLRRGGAAIASVHPMMTFVRGAAPSLVGVSFAVEGDAGAARLGRHIVRDLGGKPFAVRPGDKVLYHAMGSFSSPLLVATVALAEQVGRAAGIPAGKATQALGPIVRRTLENYLSGGSAEAFSGPLRRADLETVRQHLQALKKVPAARAAYVALARAALEYLPVRDRAALRRLLNAA